MLEKNEREKKVYKRGDEEIGRENPLEQKTRTDRSITERESEVETRGSN